MHVNSYKDYQKSIERPTSVQDEGQSTLNSFVTLDSPQYASSSIRQKTLTTSLIHNLIIHCALPISIVDHPNFRAFLSDFDPKYSPPVRQTVTNSILPQMLQSQQTKIASFLERCADVSLTVDIWTDRRMHSFIGVTVHAFNNGAPESRLLAFKCFSGSHTGQRIAEALEDIVEQHSIRGKIRCVVTDNASNMRKALSLILEVSETSVVTDGGVDDPSLWDDGEVGDGDVLDRLTTDQEHIPCFAHSLQLVVRDGLTALGLARTLLAKCCKLANLLHQSSLFRSAYEQTMGTGKVVPSSNETRWNSTYKQLRCIAELEQAKVNALLREKSHENLILSAKDLQQLQDIIAILQPFAEATDMTQGDKMITISCVVPIILALNKHLQSRSSPNSMLSSFASTLHHSLKSRFGKLFESMGIQFPTLASHNQLEFSSNLFLQAAALDPAFAFNWLEDHPGTSAEQEALRLRISGK